jgi:hypothetical protein
LVEIDQQVRGPALLPKILASDNLAGSLQQSGQNFERQPLQPNLASLFEQLAGFEVRFEN